MQSRYAILEAPSTLGLATDGVERLSGRLLELGLAERIHARHAGQLTIPEKDPELDPDTGVLNAGAIAAWSPKLADAVEMVLEPASFQWCWVVIARSCWARCSRYDGAGATACCSSTATPISSSRRRN